MYKKMFIIFIALMLNYGDCATCGGDYFGEENPSSISDYIDYITDFGYLMGDSSDIVDCCGIVERWRANFFWWHNPVYFQVWRPTSGSTYELVGQNSMNVTSWGEQNKTIAQADRITVKSGDRWGWWTYGYDIITYQSGVLEKDNVSMIRLTSKTVGDTQDWGNATVEDNRSYGIRMDVLPNNDPVFTNLPDNVTIAATTASGTSIFEVSIDDIDTYDVATLTVSMLVNSDYSFDPTTKVVTTANTFTTSAVNYLEFVVVDQCDNTATATLTVSVTNQPPVIDSLPASASLSEDETVETILHMINTSDPEGSNVTCSLASSVPASYSFSVRAVSTDYGIYSDASPGFDYSTTSSYTLTIDCTDGEYTDSETFTVTIIQNTPPVFINLQNSTSISTTDTIGTNAFTVLVSDTDNLTFSMTCDPSPCPFEIFDSGQIQISEDLSNHTTDVYNLSIFVSDVRSTVGPKLLTITIIDYDPLFTNLPETVNITVNIALGISIFEVSIEDIDTNLASLTVSMTANSNYSFNPTTRVVSTAQTFTTSAVDYLELIVVDQRDNTATATLTVSVTNQPPVIDSLPASAAISEDETVETLLHMINTSDPEGSTVTCSQASSVPASYPFSVRLVSTDYGIYSDANPGFDFFTKSSYTLTIDCTDGEYTDSETFTVTIIQNSPPVFINLQNSTSVSTTNKIGTNAFTVLVSDTDDLTFSMTCSPSPCPFEIFDSGQIQISEDLSTETTVGYDLSIYVSDSRSTVGPKVLTITIADVNDPVSITNLPLTITVVENTAVGTSVYTVSYSDLDASQSHTLSMSSSPTSGLTYFRIDSSTGEVTTNSGFNYETLGSTTFVFDVTVTDSVMSDTKKLTIEITNENEAPSFSQSIYTISSTEGVAGTVIGTPAVGITDPDSGDTYTLTNDCGLETGYFLMDSTSGQVSYQSNYDLDTGSLPTTVTCTVTVTDSGGLTDTATLIITIGYANDNSPVFSPTSYSFHISYYATAGTSVGTITATDGDTGSDGVITYTLNQSSLAVEHFAVSNTGEITVLATPQGSAIGYSTLVTLTALASDVGALSDTATVVIVVSDTTTTSTTTTTDRYRTFFEDTKNIAWFSACIFILVVSLGVLTYVILTCHGQNGCKQFCKQFRKKKSLRHWRERRIHSVDPYTTDNWHGRQPRNQNTGGVRKPPPPVELQSWRASGI